MIYKLKGRKYYRVKFRWEGRIIHKCTRATSYKVARSIEATMRSELALGNWGILKPKPMSTLADFLARDFLPFTKTRFASKPKSLDYYEYGVTKLLASSLASLALDEVTDQHAAQFAAQHANLAASTVKRFC